MFRFECDYSESCHPAIIERLAETNLIQSPGYGEDAFCEAARELLRRDCGLEPNACAIHLMIGGTQTNLTVIASLLRPYQGVISADSGHINTHETGAVEATGHKVLALPTKDGKLSAEMVQAVYDAYQDDVTKEHIVQPGMVYISWPTETGLLYTKEELSALSRTCRKLGLPLFLDGARLGYGLMSSACDLTLPEIAQLCDVFYIGGTKQGLMMGEALVFTDLKLSNGFRSMMKNRGGMLAKGRLLGIQFQTMFEDGLYYRIARQADEYAMEIRSAFAARGCDFLYPSMSNQQFPILPDAWLAKLEKDFAYSFWQRVDESHCAVRFCTSWGTQPEAVEQLIAAIRAL
ncbi:MAG: aminotransferase class I/II-fold pyridoxal phosphate-dependent enzyme [Bacillota bacterium]|nr:aminotransferase class I/II-fold pyridoxal phosphate-dependent enzyme [Bacillota bacterium]